MLILGGNGFIGSHLSDKLRADGHVVSVFDRQLEAFRKPCQDVTYYQGDFGNRGLLQEALKGTEIVFHLINTTLPKTSNDDCVFDIQSNVIETIFLLEKCLENNVKKIIFVSSGGTIYGKPTKLPVSENCPTDPECSYGISKLTIEKYLALFNHLHGLDYTIVRPSNPYGERQNPSGIQGAISVFLGKVARNEPIQIWGDGEVVRDYIYISDLIEGIYRAATVTTASRVFNLGNGVGYSLNTIVETIQKVLCRSIKINYAEKRLFDIPEIYLDITKAKTELLWTPTITLNEGIERTWRFNNGLVNNDS